MAFDTKTGDLWAADVGRMIGRNQPDFCWGNYGWNLREVRTNSRSRAGRARGRAMS